MLNNHDAEKAIEWEDGWKAGLVTVDDGRIIVPGEYRTDYRWNGWLCPRMKLDAAEQVLRALAEDAPDYYMVMLGENSYYQYFVLYNLEDDEVEIFVPDLHGWYSPGYMGWCWEDATRWGARLGTCDDHDGIHEIHEFPNGASCWEWTDWSESS